MEDVIAVYGIHKREAVAIMDEKCNMEFIAHQSRPLYASYIEDLMIQNIEKWRDNYSEEHPFMWDMTNLLAYTFSNTDLQCVRYSEYYGMNCFKEGVFVQL